MASLHQQGFTRLQLTAPSQRVFQIGGGVAALEPIGQQGRQAGIVHTQQVGQGLAACGHANAWRGFGGQGRTEKAQLGGRRVMGKRAHHVQTRDFQGRQALTQGRFEGVFPAGFDVDSAPQAFQTVHAVLGQPGLEFAVGADLLLQRLQRLDPGAQVGQAGRFIVDRLLPTAAVFVQRGHLFLQVLQAGFGFGRQRLGLGQLFSQVVQARLIGCGQSVAVGQQAFAAVFELARLFFDVALVCGQNANLLLHLHHRGTLGRGVVLGFAQGFFQVGQGRGLVFHLGGQGHALVFGHGGLLGQIFQLG